MHSPFIKRILMFVSFGLIYYSVQAQVSVSGPVCVLPGTDYQYNISANWDSASVMQICVTGGVISDSGTSCYSGNPLPFIHVTWTGDSDSGMLVFKTSLGDTSFSVVFTSQLSAGMLDTSVNLLILDSGAVPPIIHCTPATGGACSPQYMYQWQQSPDMMQWSDFPGAANPDFSFGNPPEQTIFLRRKVRESVSGAIGYSGVSSVYILSPPSGGSH